MRKVLLNSLVVSGLLTITVWEYSPRWLTRLYPVKEHLAHNLSSMNHAGITHASSHELLRLMSGDYTRTQTLSKILTILGTMEQEGVVIPEGMSFEDCLDEHMFTALHEIYVTMHPALTISDQGPSYGRDGEGAKYDFPSHAIQIYKKCFLELAGIDDPEEFKAKLSHLLIRRVLSELPHVYQQKQGELYSQFAYDRLTLKFGAYGSRKYVTLYTIEGTGERIAHHELEPLFQIRFLKNYLKSTGLDTIDISCSLENIEGDAAHFFMAGFLLAGGFRTPALIEEDMLTQSSYYVDFELGRKYLLIAAFLGHQGAEDYLSRLSEFCYDSDFSSISQIGSDLSQLIGTLVVPEHQ